MDRVINEAQARVLVGLLVFVRDWLEVESWVDTEMGALWHVCEWEGERMRPVRMARTARGGSLVLEVRKSPWRTDDLYAEQRDSRKD